MKEHTLHTSWGELHYWVSELWTLDRPTIFFFHGLTADHTMFEEQYKFFMNEYNIIAWDAPEHGKSRPFKDFSMDIATEIIKSILVKLGIDHFIAVGQSYGGYISQAFMCRYPNIIKIFIGIGTSPYGKVYYTKSDFFWLRQMGWITRCYPWNILKKVSAKGATVTKIGYDNMMQMLDVYSKTDYAKLVQTYYKAMMADNRDLHIDCPVLITRGEFDELGTVKKYCNMWHQRTGFELKIIRNAGHNANVDNPGEMNKVIDAFVKENMS